jgi:mRNA interferase RelE/StbE
MNKSVSVFYTSLARKDLKRLDAKTSQRIVITIERNTKSKPLEKAKALTGIFYGKYRYRIGEYRVIFTHDDTGKVIILTILRIKHRKDAYR